MTSTPTDRCRDERALATALANCFRFFANGQAIWWVCVSHIRTDISLTCSRLYDNYYYCEYMYSFNISFCSASGRLPAQKCTTNEKRKSDFSAPRSESFGKPNGLAANSRHTHKCKRNSMILRAPHQNMAHNSRHALSAEVVAAFYRI